MYRFSKRLLIHCCFHVKERIETSGIKQDDFSSRVEEASWPLGVVDFRWVSERCLSGWSVAHLNLGIPAMGVAGSGMRDVWFLRSAWLEDNLVILAEVLPASPQVPTSAHWSD